MFLNAADVANDPLNNFVTQAVTAYDNTIIGNNLQTPLLILLAFVLLSNADA